MTGPLRKTFASLRTLVAHLVGEQACALLATVEQQGRAKSSPGHIDLIQQNSNYSWHEVHGKLGEADISACGEDGTLDSGRTSACANGHEDC